MKVEGTRESEVPYNWLFTHASVDILALFRILLNELLPGVRAFICVYVDYCLSWQVAPQSAQSGDATGGETSHPRGQARRCKSSTSTQAVAHLRCLYPSSDTR